METKDTALTKNRQTSARLRRDGVLRRGYPQPARNGGECLPPILASDYFIRSVPIEPMVASQDVDVPLTSFGSILGCSASQASQWSRARQRHLERARPKEPIRKVAAPGSAGRSLVKPSEPRRPGGQVERERPTADDYFHRERQQRMMVRRCQAAHNRDYRRVRTIGRI